MSKFCMRFLTPLVFCFLFVIFSKSAFAITPDVSPANRDENIEAVIITFSGLTNGGQYVWCGDNDPNNCEGGDTHGSSLHPFTVTSGNSYSFTVCGDKNNEGNVSEGTCTADEWFLPRDDYNVRLYSAANCCKDGKGNEDIVNANFDIKHYIPNPIEVLASENPKPDTVLTVQVGGHRKPSTDALRNTYDIDLRGINGTANPGDPANFFVGPVGFGEREFGPMNTGVYKLTLYYNGDSHETKNVLATFTITVEDDADGGSIEGGSTTGGGTSGGGVGENPCSIGPSGECITALGTIPTTVKGFAAKILAIATDIAGGIALILMVIGSIRVLASSGDPKAVGAGREMIVAAVAGLLFLIFAVLILRFIGINIFSGVPGMGP